MPSTSKKILHRDVMRLHDAWGTAASRWGGDNLATVYASIDYNKARDQYAADHGKPFVPKGARQ